MSRSWLLLPPALAAAGCSAYKSGDSAYFDSGNFASGADAPEDGGADEEPLPPEEADEDGLLPPSSTDVYVFIANAERDTVTRVSATDLSVITAPVGEDPQVVRTTADYSTAVVFNRGSDDVSVVDAASLAVLTVGVRPNLNSMVMSPDGRWVAVYHDQAARDASAGDDGSPQSYNEVSLVDVVNLTHTPMVVGFNPREIRFTADSARMVVVSDAYLAVVDLGAASPSPERVRISDDTADPPVAEEIVLTPDGRFGVIRQFGADALQVVDLVGLTAAPVEVGDTPTDLDVTPDGAQLIAVARGSNELWIYDAADPFAEAEVLPLPVGEVLGSIVMSPDDS